MFRNKKMIYWQMSLLLLVSACSSNIESQPYKAAASPIDDHIYGLIRLLIIQPKTVLVIMRFALYMKIVMEISGLAQKVLACIVMMGSLLQIITRRKG